MQKLYTILHVKLYNAADFNMWLNWYTKFIKSDEIVIIDDNSIINVRNFLNQYINITQNNNIKVYNASDCSNTKINRQTSNYNFIIKNILNVNKDDIIIIPDIDEFWWYDTTKFGNFKDCVNFQRELLKTDTILVANILMSSDKFLKQRHNVYENYNDLFKYRCNIDFCENKPINFYNGELLEFYHTGFNNHKAIAYDRGMWDNDIGSKVLYDYYLRLYHYRLTTEFEYKQKMSIDANNEEMNSDNNFRRYASPNIENFMKTLYPHYIGLEYNIFDDTIDKEYKKII